ncbi:hypothetical protein EYR38_010828 [Pleurotus pulmonarius]|nr:hypothetical protein EYR38_010828 [Pleurotus pulmonarius]
MAGTTDTEVARLAEMVASLAVQVASLVPQSNNIHIPPVAPIPPPAPAPPTATPSVSATLVPSAAPSAATATSVEPSDNIDGEPSNSSSHRRWYVVIVGLQVGVFRGWTNAAPLVLGVTGSIYNREPTRETAISSFNAAAALGQLPWLLCTLGGHVLLDSIQAFTGCPTAHRAFNGTCRYELGHDTFDPIRRTSATPRWPHPRLWPVMITNPPPICVRIPILCFLPPQPPASMTKTNRVKRLNAAASYYHRNRDTLREKARLRMARLRAENATKSDESKAQASAALRASQAKYRTRKKASNQPDPSPRTDGGTNYTNEYCKRLGAANQSDDEDHEPLSDTSNSGYFGDDNPSDDEDDDFEVNLTGRSRVVKATVPPPRESFSFSRSEMPKLLRTIVVALGVDVRSHANCSCAVGAAFDLLTAVPTANGATGVFTAMFNYKFGRYIHALGLHTLDWPSHLTSFLDRYNAWRDVADKFAVIIHVRQDADTKRHHPYRDFRFASCYKMELRKLDVIVEGCTQRAYTLLNIRPSQMKFIVFIIFEDKHGEGLGYGCFMYKVADFTINQYPPLTIPNAPEAFRQILVAKGRKGPVA